MKRREFLKLVAAAWPASAAAQQPERLRRLGLLLGSTERNGELQQRVDTFVQAFKELGWIEGRNIRLDVRWTGGDPKSNAEHAREMVRQQPDVIFAAPSNVVIAVQRETRSIPIVFANVSDPIAQGVVDNLARPSGNLTGFTNLEISLMGKWLQILKEAKPSLKRTALMISTNNAAAPIWYRMFKEAASKLAIDAVSAPISSPGEIESVVRSVGSESNGAMIVAGDTMTSAPATRRLVIDLVAKYRVPALYGELAFAQEGGLISYGIDRSEPFRRAASYVDRILKGEKPSDLPVQQPTKFYFVINLKTAKALGLELSPALVATADTLIE